MTPEQVRERNTKYTIIVIPGSESESTRSFSINRWALAGVGLGTILIVTAVVVAVLLYTPARSLLPVSNAELEKRYGEHLAEIEDQLHTLLQQMTMLRTYNLRLRSALGEPVALDDTVAFRDSVGAPNVDVKRMNQDEHVDESVDEPARVNQAFQEFRPPATTFASNVTFVFPAEGYATRGFDPAQYHYGLDIAGKQGAPIFAAADGSVLFAGWTYEDGFVMMLAHDLGYTTIYKHNQVLLKHVGALIKRGEVIALLGNTGTTSTGPHCHFELWRDGVAQDPSKYVIIPQ
jgi:murein DD-endopeptidase MepM/ murein hydrolase activator NlpD